MASHQIKTALLVLAFIVACRSSHPTPDLPANRMAAVTLQVIISVCWMSLDLQEWVVVRGAPIMTRVKFGKCHHK